MVKKATVRGCNKSCCDRSVSPSGLQKKVSDAANAWLMFCVNSLESK